VRLMRSRKHDIVVTNDVSLDEAERALIAADANASGGVEPLLDPADLEAEFASQSTSSPTSTAASASTSAAEEDPGPEAELAPKTESKTEPKSKFKRTAKSKRKAECALQAAVHAHPTELAFYEQYAGATGPGPAPKPRARRGHDLPAVCRRSR